MLFSSNGAYAQVAAPGKPLNFAGGHAEHADEPVKASKVPDPRCSQPCTFKFSL